MAKRSDFDRVPRDAYDTPQAAVDVLLSHIDRTVPWIEPAAGANALANALAQSGIRISHRRDIAPRAPGIIAGDGAILPPEVDGHGVVTNPPFRRCEFRRLLHAWLDQERTCWILQPSGFMHTQWFARERFHAHMAEVVSLPRLQWIPGSEFKETTDHVWVRYEPEAQVALIFHPQKAPKGKAARVMLKTAPFATMP